MNCKFIIPALATIGFVIGCSDSQNQTAHEKTQKETTITKTEHSPVQQKPAPILAPEPEQVTPESEQTKAEIGSNTPTEAASKSPEAIEKDAQEIADSFIAKGSKTPRKELEQKIKKALEAAAAKSSTTARLE